MSSLSKLNYIKIGHGGTFKPSANPDFHTTAADADAIFEVLQQKGQRKMLLYFHGGLVNEKSGMQTAIAVTAKITNETDVHPVSFIWETGLLETISQNINDIWKTTFFQKLLQKIIKVAGSKLGVSIETLGANRGLNSISYAEISAELLKEAPFDKYFFDNQSRSANITNGNDKQLQDEIEVTIEEELMSDPYFRDNPLAQLNDKELAKINTDKITSESGTGTRNIFSLARLVTSSVSIIYKVIKRFIAKRDHGFYPTIIEEILREIYVADAGSWVWGKMKMKAEVMWQPNERTID